MNQFPDQFDKASDLNLWLPKQDQGTFGYSDGSVQEKYLEDCMREAHDRSSLGTMLGKYVRDWSSEYHLSPKRGSLLRPLVLDGFESVLELGAGCGAITRYLGETLPRVVAVEGSDQRAKIDALRCRDLKHVQVVCSNFQDIGFDENFDIVTLIGVLEYSGKYIDSESPYDVALELAKQWMSDDGVLIIAIENKLGLKYFSGCSEDHTGIPFDGIQGYPSGQPVRTFGRRELTRLLNRNGFDHVKFMYPFPDYKMPDMIVLDDEDYLSREEPYLYQWVGNDEFRDYSTNARIRVFEESMTAKQLESNGLLLDMSNSFLVVAGRDESRVQGTVPPNVVVRKYNTNRRKKFMTCVSLVKDDADVRTVTREPLDPANKEGRGSTLKKTLSHTSRSETEFYVGKTLMEQFLYAVKMRAVDRRAAIAMPLRKWQFFLTHESERIADGSNLPGDYVDCILWNLIESADGLLVYIDREWNYLESLAVRFIMYRGMMHLYDKIIPMIHTDLKEFLVDPRKETFVKFGFELIGLKIEDDEMDRYLTLEKGFKSRALPYTPSQTLMSSGNAVPSR